MPKLSTTLIVVALGLVAVASIVVYVRASNSDRERVDLPEAMVRLQKATVAMGEAKVIALNETSAFRDAVFNAATRVDDLRYADDAAHLADEVAGMLSARFAEGTDSSAYTAWRETSGYTRRPLDVLRKSWFLDTAYEAYHGNRPPSDLNWDAYFDAMIVGQDAFGGGRTKPRGVSIEPSLVRVSVKRLTRADPRWPPLDGPIGDALDFGGPTHISSPWWSAPTSSGELLALHGEVRAAAVGVLIEYADGVRRPVGFSLFQNPTTRTWYIEAAFHGSLERDVREGVRWEY